jgi:drug/metabolite transporter (DMT)-like permease
MKLNKNWQIHLLLLATTIIASYNYSISKSIMPSIIQPSLLIWIRMGFTSIFFGLIILITNQTFHIEKRHRFDLLICGLTGVSINQIFFYEGLSRTLPINASILMTLIPVTVFILNKIIYNYKYNLSQLIGLAISFGGTILLLSHSKNSLNGIFIGDLFIIINAISYAIFLIQVKKLSNHYASSLLVFWVFAIGWSLTSLYTLSIGSFKLDGTIDTHFIFVMLFILFGATVFNYYISIFSLKKFEVASTSIYVYIQPIIASLIAIISNKDQFEWDRICFAILILIGVYFVVAKKRATIQ